MFGRRTLEAGPLASYSPSVNVAYFDFSPNNRRPGNRDSSEITPLLIADVTSARRQLVGLEIFNASSHLKDIVDLSKFKKHGADSMKARVSPEQVLQVVERMIRAEERHPGIEAEFVVASIKEGIRIRDNRKYPQDVLID